VTAGGSDTTGTKTYSYQGNTITVTDAAGKWKKFTLDALGNLTQVNEPNPGGGSDYVMRYTYDVLGHLATVPMTLQHDADAEVQLWDSAGFLAAERDEFGKREW
jgi:YD repeat-containing protein